LEKNIEKHFKQVARQF